MKVEWNVDPVANKMLWDRLSLLPKELLGGLNPRFVLDLGGGTGDFASCLKGNETTVISLDTNRDILKNRIEGVQGILGDATNLPFKDGSVDAVTARAILHHFPSMLLVSLSEVRRILKGGGFFLVQEPLSRNYLANIVRKYFSTERHEAGERPLDEVILEKALRKKFEVKRKEHHFLLSYLYPHIIQRLPGFLKGVARLEARIVNALDEEALAKIPVLRQYAAYITILGERREEGWGDNRTAKPI